MKNKYMSAFQYIGSRITNVRIKNDFIELSDSNDIKKSIDVSHEIMSIEKINDDKSLFGLIDVNIKVNARKENKKYNVSMSIEGCFTAPVEIGKDMFKQMLQINGLTSLYSVARGFIQSTTSQTLMSGNVLLPMFNVVQYSEDLNEKKEKQSENGTAMH